MASSVMWYSRHREALEYPGHDLVTQSHGRLHQSSGRRYTLGQELNILIEMAFFEGQRSVITISKPSNQVDGYS